MAMSHTQASYLIAQRWTFANGNDVQPTVRFWAPLS